MTDVIQIEFLELESGKCPFEDWLEDLDVQSQSIVTTRLDRVSQGNFGVINHIDGKIWELKFKRPAYRIYYYKETNKIIMLLCAGDKSTQTRDINKAIEYGEYYENKENKN